MHIDPTLAAIIGFLLGTAVSTFSVLLGSASSEKTLRLVHELYGDRDEYNFEPETTTTTVENQDIRISMSEEEEETE